MTKSDAIIPFGPHLSVIKSIAEAKEYYVNNVENPH